MELAQTITSGPPKTMFASGVQLAPTVAVDKLLVRATLLDIHHFDLRAFLLGNGSGFA